MDHKGKDRHGEALSTSEKVAFEELIEIADNYSNYAQTLQEQVGDAWND